MEAWGRFSGDERLGLLQNFFALPRFLTVTYLLRYKQQLISVNQSAHAINSLLTESQDISAASMPGDDVVVEDIEDIFVRGMAKKIGTDSFTPTTSTRSITPPRRSRPAPEVYAKQTTVLTDVQPRQKVDTLDDGVSGSTMLPGTQTVFVKTQGCAHNVSDGEYMAGLLAAHGYKITEEWSEDVDVFLFNSCTVKGPSQDSFLNMVAKAKSTGAAVVVAGCVPQGQPGREELEGLSIIGVQQIHRVVEVVEESVKGHAVRLLGQGVRPALDLPKIRRNALIEIVPISMGCLNRCTYCKTKHARGDLVSYTPESVVARVQSVVAAGVREVWLSSEDTGAYGKDIGIGLPTLLDAIVQVIPEGVMLRVGMTNPPHIIEHMEAVARVLNHPRVFSFLHIPVQCASDKVLQDMKREYTRANFELLVDYLLEKVPGITIATDIICGFPTESEDDFLEGGDELDGVGQTLDLMEKYKFPVVNIAQFYPRPGTVAAKMTKLKSSVVKDRSRRVTALFESYKTFDNLVGTTQDVWVVEFGKDPNYVVGHTSAYVQVLIPRQEDLLGRRVQVVVDSASKWSVKATLLRVWEETEALPQVSIQRTSVLPAPSELKATNKPLPGRNLAASRASIEEDYGEDDPDAARKVAEEEEDGAGSAAARKAMLAWAGLVVLMCVAVTMVDPLLGSLGMGIAVAWERVGLRRWREGRLAGGAECCGGGCCSSDERACADGACGS